MPAIITNINVVSLVLILVFILPVAAGAISEFSRDRVRNSVTALLESTEFILGLVLSIYITKKIFIDHDEGIYSKIYDMLPGQIKVAMPGQDMLVYVIAVPVLLFIMLFAIRIITGPLYTYVLIPIADLIYSGVRSSGPVVKGIMGALWQLPKAAVMTVVFATVLYFSMYYVYSPALSEWSSNSKEFQLIYNDILFPVLNSNIAKKIPVIVGDIFRKSSGGSISARESNAVDKTIEKLTGGNIKIIHYFNGVTLDEAVKSNEQIDQKAREITAKGKDDKERATLLYKWISRNIAYDYAKAERIASNPAGENSGSVIAFDTRKGICFDYSSLYISMCRAVDLKVRLITGQGYSGVSWGDHAWNQVWISAEERWVNVDTTFGSTGLNYFDKQNFSVDHEYAEIQGEW
jgi:transglutaminase-like putative cysteine protease